MYVNDAFCVYTNHFLEFGNNLKKKIPNYLPTFLYNLQSIYYSETTVRETKKSCSMPSYHFLPSSIITTQPTIIHENHLVEQVSLNLDTDNVNLHPLSLNQAPSDADRC